MNTFFFFTTRDLAYGFLNKRQQSTTLVAHFNVRTYLQQPIFFSLFCFVFFGVGSARRDFPMLPSYFEEELLRTVIRTTNSHTQFCLGLPHENGVAAFSHLVSFRFVSFAEAKREHSVFLTPIICHHLMSHVMSPYGTRPDPTPPRFWIPLCQ
mmetsp:Transcript_22382/g.62354  ORF Transcript_22382/g.62354 Transcript_22382/m.62354 type:complete len:153 (-) Transcript_22382:275-733(-)